MKILNTQDKNFSQDFKNILNRAKIDIKQVSSIVNDIINDIIQNGNKAVYKHISKFDNWTPKIMMNF
jgi:histidinol dehydrogenase